VPDLLSVLPLDFMLGGWAGFTVLFKMLRIVSPLCSCFPVPTALRMRNFETLVPHDSLTS
jgi:hypothetical protein